jgi:thiosulfate/3-mercaptopyruvate sulfurtransferase
MEDTMKKKYNFITSTLLLIAGTILFFGCQPNPTKTYTLSDFFKTTDWVAQHLNDANFVLVDTRTADDYAAGHIPGAINIPRTKFYFARTQIDGQTFAYDIPTAAELVDILTANGITPDSTVVAYDTDISSYGGRFPWVLKVYGHEKAYVIEGGAEKWKDADGRSWDTTPVTPTPADKPYKITSWKNNYRINKADVAAAIDTANGNHTKPGYIISDVRTPNEYAGYYVDSTTDPNNWTPVDADGNSVLAGSEVPFVYHKGGRPGHIPYAKFSIYTNDIYTDYLDANGKPVASSLQKEHNVQVLKSESDLRAHFEGLGITTDKIIYNYCEGGFRSGVYTLVLLGLGYPHVYNYDGSWNEWSIQDDDLYPVAIGDGRDGSRP